MCATGGPDMRLIWRLIGAFVLSTALAAAPIGCKGGGGSGDSDGECAVSSEAEACFEVSFTGLWTEADFPFEFPGGAHFSPPVGATHIGAVHLWESGQPASDGIEEMAETGDTSALLEEIVALIASSDAAIAVEGGRISATETTRFQFKATADHSRLTLVSMVAPSPDWFVGIEGYDLRPGGEWIEDELIDLDRIYDAGTDSGDTFSAANSNTQPADPIARLLDAHFMDGGPAIATFRVTRQ